MEIYRNLPLRWVAVAVGLLLTLVWIRGLLAPKKFRRAALQFPRSLSAAILLFLVDALWCTWIVWQAGDKNLLAPKYVGYSIIWGLAVGSVAFRVDFAAVRGLALFLLLVACVMVNAAFLVETPARLLIPALAYVWVILGMWWAMSPWKMRNAVEWMVANDARCKAVSAVHLGIALLLVIFAFAFY